MKIAVLNTNGTRAQTEEQLVYYYRVEDDYDFISNDAIDVTSYDNVELFYETNRIDYIEYQEWLVSFDSQNVFSGLSPSQQEVLAKNFATSKINRDSVFSEAELVDHAILMHELAFDANAKRSMKEMVQSDFNNPNPIYNIHNSLKLDMFSSSTVNVGEMYSGVTNMSNYFRTFDQVVTGARNSSNATTQFLRGADGTPYNLVGIPIKKDSKIVSMVSTGRVSQTWEGLVLTGTNIFNEVIYRQQLTSQTKKEDNELNILIPSGQKIYLALSGQSIDYPRIDLYIKEI